jgi:hypothetical protein
MMTSRKRRPPYHNLIDRSEAFYFNDRDRASLCDAFLNGVAKFWHAVLRLKIDSVAATIL